MSGKIPSQELVEHGKPLLIWTLTGLMDSLFLIIWVIAQHITAVIINFFKLTGVDANTLNIFQIMFAASTLIPILIWMVKDIVIILIRSWSEIKQILKQERTKYSSLPNITQADNVASKLPSVTRLVQNDQDNEDGDSTVVVPISGKSGSTKP